MNFASIHVILPIFQRFADSLERSYGPGPLARMNVDVETR